MVTNATCSQDGTSTTPAFDYLNPMFISTSDVTGISLIIVHFSGSNFKGWKHNMIVSLSIRNKMAFINGSYIRPTELP